MIDDIYSETEKSSPYSEPYSNKTHVDLAILGGGPAGYAAALYGASCGLSIAVVERNKVGGTCLHQGCVPAKELLETASILRTCQSADEFGVTTNSVPVLNMTTMQQRKSDVIEQLHKGLSGLMKGRHISIVNGTGKLLPGKQLQIYTDTGEQRIISAENIVLATGSAPRTLPNMEINGNTIVTSDEVLNLDHIPTSAAVIGGGAIGCEFVSFLHDIGTQVTLLEALPRLLAGCDVDISNALTRSFKKKGVKVHTGIQITGHEIHEKGVTLFFGDNESVSVEMVIVAIGRRPVTEGILSAETNVRVDERGFIVVNDSLQTTADGIWAIGDVINTPQLAHVGFAEGIQVIKHILGENPPPLQYEKVPWGIYTHPEVAFAGMTEEQAKQSGYNVIVRKDPFGGNSRARVIGETDGMVKVIAEADADGHAGKILGVHIIGPWATELLSPGYLAVNWEATPDDFAGLIQPHPTLSEAFGEVAIALTGRSLHVA